MPRTKKASRRGNYNGGSHSGRSGAKSASTPFDGVSAPRRGGRNGFTLQEEAQNTGRHHNFWKTDQRLRHTKVNFISAGALESTESKDSDSPETSNPEATFADMTLGSPSEEIDEEILVEVFEESEESKQEAIPEDIQSPSEGRIFFIDTQGTTPVDTGLPPPQPRAASPTPSNSSEEVILFAGRDQNGRGLSKAPKTIRTPTNPINAKIKIVEDKIHKQEELLEEVLHQKPTAAGIPSRLAAQDTTEESSADYEAILSKKGSRYRNRGRHNHQNTKQTEEDALIADYLANIEKEDIPIKSFSRRDLGGTEDEFWQDETEVSSGEPTGAKKQAMWDRDDIVDFDDLSTSDGVMGDVREILSKRIRASGLQYLVVWNDQPVDGARWVPVTTLSSVNALLSVQKFEAEEELLAEFMGSYEEDSDESDNMEVDIADEDDEDQEGLLKRKVERMSDEQIARVLAKQEELGMGSEEILLFNDESDDEDVAFTKSTFSPVILGSKGKGKARISGHPRGEFPAASVLADAYDGFDVMDFDRPSLKKKPKGRKGKLEFDISDSELEESMVNAWDNDRIKKKERKQEREELRAQGLAGSKNGKPDLKQKHKEGMGIHVAVDEIKKFLIGNDTTLALPPMKKDDRKIVHELANAFKLKSKSDGNGKKRYPVLYKTQRTRPFFERAFDTIESRLTRRFLPRMDVGGKITVHAGRGRGFNNAAVSYRDGDVVGGSAPELSAENRGRAMLEKMGWSTGTALGALNNKGILQPVTHVVKTTKAGLG